ncbi:unnamed protein product (macronuclear) [Paramecium tetraurelia]|uniref:Uncharacterized protein n=1 Tax=Paramecium tetraurelia TaxID=5888 RepID=A0E5N0_PARTE|nr:uncharacterized protein GSPATT00003458001 [Paramecium tetraurelia]CAK90597.1 unnamed protein product [Paramecium tetraurelia]|eukprot:XP_001457994.1 hypothetical protein (macronuclear) [Paramecium tetraurelia strain d4-2]
MCKKKILEWENELLRWESNNLNNRQSNEPLTNDKIEDTFAIFNIAEQLQQTYQKLRDRSKLVIYNLFLAIIILTIWSKRATQDLSQYIIEKLAKVTQLKQLKDQAIMIKRYQN